ncbi:hypothetical protein ALO95_200106 [Pseudomonas syringae pv. antirrhini]|uniref:YkgJ family cysteine cluster protein n=1 Tax=Pseudomonas TaxID=286 RepID=UPI000B1504E6|nr:MULTISPECIES: YkgJ family cysteine cluster protein [Pseudomonas]RMP42532.1 hypothetical protein ALQ23_200065 [Pseudomonas syringae pv. antirrhini]RMW23549.1 hypothetical protein ALO95_200106 [Pseudomonas syringae pv. antirrhini]WIN08844.1 YkgJ family cysteine cluster protein [Pseudomonas syringae pv. antirrhini str. 126]
MKFECVGCGECCKGRFLPLTLEETVAWLGRGHEVVIMLEGFDSSNWPTSSQAYEHHSRRSALVKSGVSTARVIPIFAGNNLNACPNLQADNACAIYEQRPLVCRIYPREINPFIALAPEAKECPPESWIQDGDPDLADTETSQYAGLIYRSRSADRQDAAIKLAVCDRLDFRSAGWKGDGLVVYQPSIETLLRAIEQSQNEKSIQPITQWTLVAATETLRRELLAKGLTVQSSSECSAAFVPLPSAH